MASIATKADFPPHFAPERELREQLSNHPGSQCCLEGRYELLLMVHDVPQPGESRRQPLFFWRRSDRCWLQPNGTGLSGLADLLTRYGQVIEDHEDTLEETESAEEIFAVLRHAAPLARSSRNLLQALQQTLRMEPEDREVRSLRDQVVALERSAELLLHDARAALELWRARKLEEHSRATEKVERTTFRINLLMGLFLPLMALSGLLGMNVALPGFLERAFWPLLLIGALAGGVLLWLALRGGFTGEKNPPD